MKNEFWLPSIYKPFYINVLFVRNTVNKKIVENSSADTFFVIIDVYNGIGLYDKKTKLYNIGSIDITFEESYILDNFINTGRTTNVTLEIYRDKPLFNTTYKESITTVFTGFTINYDATYRSKELIVKYTSPDNEYGIKINRDITLKVNLEIGGNIETNPFSLYHIQDNQYNICQTCEIDETLVERVEKKSNDFLYYVVNDGFYKYFIAPEYENKSNIEEYQSYNGNEVEGLSGDTRIEYDLNPNKVKYDDEKYLPRTGFYTKDNNYCITTPFFRMYPSISSEPKKKESPFAVKLKKSGSAIVLEKNIYNYEVDDVKRFYLIGVKSPLTVLGNDNYDKELEEGKVIRPEQDYVTFIEYISEIEAFNR